MTIYILYSADYELFLGGNYCDEKEVLIDPAKDLLNLCQRLNIPLTLFADILSILRYRELNISGFPKLAEDQLKDAIVRGHDVQSHVHPHWNDTFIDGRRYTVNTGYFLLGNLDRDPEALYAKVLANLVTSRNYLHQLLRQVRKDYQCIAFRAGGYGLQPQTKVILKALAEAGFIIDSSIVPGLVVRNSVNEIDFSRVPDRANYYLDHDLGTPSGYDQGIFEIPIASCTFSPWENFLCQMSVLSRYVRTKRMKKPGESRQGDRGYPIQQNPTDRPVIPEHSKYYNFLREFWHDRFFYLDCSTDHEKMVRCTKNYLQQFEGSRGPVFFSCNMHPKEMTEEHFIALEKYHTTLKHYYRDTIQAISYQQAAEMLHKKIFLP